jgi:hypothetical protein
MCPPVVLYHPLFCYVSSCLETHKNLTRSAARLSPSIVVTPKGPSGLCHGEPDMFMCTQPHTWGQFWKLLRLGNSYVANARTGLRFSPSLARRGRDHAAASSSQIRVGICRDVDIEHWTMYQVKVSCEVGLGSFERLVAANEKAIANRNSSMVHLFTARRIGSISTGHLTSQPMSTQPSLGKSLHK